MCNMCYEVFGSTVIMHTNVCVCVFRVLILPNFHVFPSDNHSAWRAVEYHLMHRRWWPGTSAAPHIILDRFISFDDIYGGLSPLLHLHTNREFHSKNSRIIQDDVDHEEPSEQKQPHPSCLLHGSHETTPIGHIHNPYSRLIPLTRFLAVCVLTRWLWPYNYYIL